MNGFTLDGEGLETYIMQRPRVTLRALMVVVLAIGIIFHLVLTAYRVHGVREYHLHTYVAIHNGYPLMISDSGAKTPFWPRYWRCLLGRPWRRQALCGFTEGRLEELCQFSHPEILEPLGSGHFEVRHSEAQIKMHRRLSTASN